MYSGSSSEAKTKLPYWKSFPNAFWAGLVLLVMACIMWFLFLEAFRFHGANQSNRDALVTIHSALNPGDSYATVLTTYWKDRTGELRISTESPTEWVVSMPMEFGASDWRLVITFDEATRKVTAIRVRTSDGPAPKDGPRDK